MLVQEARQRRSRCWLTLALMRAVEHLSHLSSISSRALLALVGVSGLGDLCLPLHPSSPVCLSVFKCALHMGTAVLLEEGPSLMCSLELHQLCEELSFVCKVTPRYLGLGLQHLTLRVHDVSPHTLQRL